MFTLLPPHWLIRGAVAAVWLYEGLWCKLLRGEPHELEVVEAVPFFGPRIGALFLTVLGVVEVALGAWVLTGIEPWWCAVAQTVLLDDHWIIKLLKLDGRVLHAALTDRHRRAFAVLVRPPAPTSPHDGLA